jgi:putative ABC transport system substrate-binding protein
MPVVGFLSGVSPGSYAPFVAAFRQGLSETGYVEGQNLAIEYRWAEGHYDRLPALAANLVDHKVELIAVGTSPSALAAKGATSTIPIVFVSADDPVAAGLIASLALPGGNLTGISTLMVELLPKLLELISELVPCRIPDPTRAGSGTRERVEACDPQGQLRKRDGRRLRNP